MRKYVIAALSVACLALAATLSTGCSMVPNGAQPTFPRTVSDSDPPAPQAAPVPAYPALVKAE